MDVFKRFQFEAAHRLPRVPDDHKCARLHGHSFTVEVHVRGALDPTLEWVVDFADLSRAWKPLHEALDHRYLNDVEGLENPTSEVLARWVWRRLAKSLPGLCRIVVQETCNAGCIYHGDDEPQA